jgi:O-acetyl-ADP-ribose deacetylase (regulator of RNase III)
MKTIPGDILNITEGIICHQVNCKGVMGTGIALKIRKKWPHVYNDYRWAYKEGLLFLGNMLTTRARPGLHVAHLCGQDGYGRDKMYTDYEALAKCMTTLSAIDRPIWIPRGMGCSNAGGDWTIVSDMIEHLLPSATIVTLG